MEDDPSPLDTASTADYPAPLDVRARSNAPERAPEVSVHDARVPNTSMPSLSLSLSLRHQLNLSLLTIISPSLYYRSAH